MASTHTAWISNLDFPINLRHTYLKKTTSYTNGGQNDPHTKLLCIFDSTHAILMKHTAWISNLDFPIKLQFTSRRKCRSVGSSLTLIYNIDMYIVYWENFKIQNTCLVNELWHLARGLSRWQARGFGILCPLLWENRLSRLTVSGGDWKLFCSDSCNCFIAPLLCFLH